MSNRIIFKIEGHEFVVNEYPGEWYQEFEIARVNENGFTPYHFNDDEIISGTQSGGAIPEYVNELQKFIDLYRLALSKYNKYRELRVFE